MKTLLFLSLFGALLQAADAPKSAKSKYTGPKLEASFVEDPQKSGCMVYRVRQQSDGKRDYPWVTVVADIGPGCYDRKPIYHDKDGQPPLRNIK